MRRILPLAALLATAPVLASCNDHYGLVMAKQIENRGELVGGPVAMADLGDFLLQNDQIKVGILGVTDSVGPGVFGGSIVDLDLRRDRLGQENAQGRDRFVEIFPVINLLVPHPNDTKDAAGNITATDVKVLKDGKDGEASIRVEGKGAFLFEALSILQTQAPALKLFFPDLKTEFRFRTDYVLKEGWRHVLIRTTVMLDETFDGCPDLAQCAPCEYGHQMDPATGCLKCDCETPQPLDTFSEPRSVFGQIFGDPQNSPTRKYRAGVVGGDFVFFGGGNSVFAPGSGFDIESAVHAAVYAGRNTFQEPLAYDFMTASGGDVSYGYFTVAREGEKSPVVNIPILTGSTTAFLSGGKSCLFDASDDAECDGKRAWTYERYLAVGEGDVASVADDVWKTRAAQTGEIRGVVLAETGEPSPKAKVYVFKNPVPGRRYASVDEIAEANLRRTGGYGLVNQIDADVGLDRVLDGDFHATIPPGQYVVVARTADGMGFSVPQSIEVVAGQTAAIAPVVETPGVVEYRIVDQDGQAVPAKVALIAVDAQGQPLDGDGTRRVYLGDSRHGNGVRAMDHVVDGRGAMRVEPGTYLLRASRGPEYGIYEAPVTVGAGGVARVDGIIRHEVDTAGWLSTDTHLHATPSHDSGMDMSRRLRTIVDEHVELAIATDHDVNTDYGPTIKALLLDPYVKNAVGVETTTIEQGHFIGFPLVYDNTIVPTHGSPDPTCQSGGEIVSSLRNRGDGIDPFVILAHPRDGFFGYMYQLGVDPFTMLRQVGTLEKNNPVFRTAACDFDGMELINGKRFDLVRTATVAEVMDWNHCQARVDAAQDEAALEKACPEMDGWLKPCVPGERFVVCRDKNRTSLAWQAMKRILTRTPEEQEALLGFSTGDTTPMVTGQDLYCKLSDYEKKPVPPEVADLPCTHYSGHVEDFFLYLEHGLVKTQIAGSDGHETVHEPGYPRTYFKSETDSPGALAVADAVKSLKGGHALTTYGPFITASIDGKSFGETARATAGGKVELDLKVQTASWFGVDRIEIYQNGHLLPPITVTSKTEDIVDYEGKISLDVPKGRDSWIVIIAMGLEERNLMRKVSLDIPFGEVQISKVTADAFSLLPVVSGQFARIPSLPDWFPIPAYAVSNPIFLDTGTKDGDGNYNDKYDAPLPFPEFCSQPCGPEHPEVTCPADQVCLKEELQCGYPVNAKCEHRLDWQGGEIDPKAH